MGGRSRVASQLLSGLGFKKVYNLEGGIKAWGGGKAEGPVELNMDLIRGDESPMEIIRLAYGMENALESFYSKLKSGTDDPELQRFYQDMVAVEQSHKGRLFELHKEVDPPGQDLDAFEAAINTQIMEGGFNLEEFMEKNASFMNSVNEVLNLAMMLETQALDLYLRFSDKSANTTTKDVLFKLADEEKAHLAALGDLLEKRL